MKKVKKRLLLLNLDTILPQQAKNIIDRTLTLASDPKNHIYLLSEHGIPVIASWFGSNMNQIGLAAEHGCFYKKPGTSDWIKLIEDEFSWKDMVATIMHTYSEKTDGSYVETKHSGISWNYNHADPDYGSWQARDLYSHLEVTLTAAPVDIIFENKKVEVKAQQCKKGFVVDKIIEEHSKSENKFDWVLCLSDDGTDESLFKTLNKNIAEGHLPHQTYTCTLLSSRTQIQAKYFLPDTDAMINLLDSLVTIK